MLYSINAQGDHQYQMHWVFVYIFFDTVQIRYIYFSQVVSTCLEKLFSEILFSLVSVTTNSSSCSVGA